MASAGLAEALAHSRRGAGAAEHCQARDGVSLPNENTNMYGRRMSAPTAKGRETVTLIMWGSAIVGWGLFGVGAAATNNYVKTFLIVLSLPFLWVAGRLWNEKKQAQDDADGHQLGRLIGAAYDKAPGDGFLDRFVDNPWQSWPKVAGDIDVGRVWRAPGESPAFFIVDVRFNEKNQDEDLAAYTVTFVIIPLRSARPGRLEASMIPEYYEAIDLKDFLYVYRAKRWNEWGRGGDLPVEEIPQALACATTIAVRLGHSGHGL